MMHSPGGLRSRLHSPARLRGVCHVQQRHVCPLVLTAHGPDRVMHGLLCLLGNPVRVLAVLAGKQLQELITLQLTKANERKSHFLYNCLVKLIFLALIHALPVWNLPQAVLCSLRVCLLNKPLNRLLTVNQLCIDEQMQ
jgi:hypothetical protein